MNIWSIICLIFIPFYFWLVYAFRHFRQWLLYYLFGAFGFTILVALIARITGFDGKLAAIEIFHTNIIANLIGIPSQALFSDRIQLPTAQGYSILQIGIECSAIVEMAALVGLVAFYPAFTLLQKTGKILLGLAVTYIVNLFRMLIIVGTGYYFGMQYIFLAHAFIGRIFFFVCVVALYWYILTKPTIAGMGQFLERGKKVERGTTIAAPRRLSFRSNIFLILIGIGFLSLMAGSFVRRGEWSAVWQEKIIPQEAKMILEAPKDVLSQNSDEKGTNNGAKSDSGKILGTKTKEELIPQTLILDKEIKNLWRCHISEAGTENILKDKTIYYLWVNGDRSQKLIYPVSSFRSESKLQGKEGEQWNCYISASKETINRKFNEQ